jgi:hypothetical protein
VKEREVRWRAVDSYTPANASKAGLLNETRHALELYGEVGDVGKVRQVLLDGALPQRSRETRATIVEFIQRRLTAWNPPKWVCRDLVEASCLDDPTVLQALLLLHAVRQDQLLYDFVQEVVLPHWRNGEQELRRDDVQRFLDEATPLHPEIGRWTHGTREKLAGNVLTILRDYGLMQGTARKHIIEPVVSATAAWHLLRLLREEGIPYEDIPVHPDWNLWLWTPDRVRAAMKREGEDQ